jgi:CubicO group peptidase (beta-lactamase class C family)
MGNLAAKQQLLDAKAKGVLDKYGIPNIAAVLVRDNGSTVLHTVQGVRNTNLGSIAANKVDKSDYFVVGSISKPITGFLIACLINQGVLTWNTTIADVFSEFKSKVFRDSCGMNENFLGVKLHELMAHTCGINGTYYFELNDDDHSRQDADPFRFFGDQQAVFNKDNSRYKEWETLESVVYLRYLYTILCLKNEKYIYGAAKNLGYQNKSRSGYGSTPVICVAMIERLMGKPFETIMADLLSGPLNGLHIKYGSLPNGMQQHKYDDASGKFVPQFEYNDDEFMPFISKFIVGGISCTVAAMAQYIRYNLRALNYATVFDVAQYQEPVTDFAKGGMLLGGGLNHEPLNHEGATEQCLALTYIFPYSGYGFAVMMNCNGGNAVAALNELIEETKKIHQNWDSI